MSIDELMTLLKYADIDHGKKVYVEIRNSNGEIDVRDISSYHLYSDCIKLNICIDD